MITTDQFLRRSLIAPIAVPILAVLYMFSRSDLTPLAWIAVPILVCTLVMGGVPYACMIYDRRDMLFSHTGRELEHDFAMLPLWLVGYYLRIMAPIAGVSLLLIPFGAGIASEFVWILAVDGLIAIPVLGYLIVGGTFFWMGILQLVGLVLKPEK